VNAHRNAADYQFKQQQITTKTKLKIQLKPGGGAAIQLRLI